MIHPHSSVEIDVECCASRQDLDFNRAELVKLIYAISMQYPPMLDELVKQSDCLVMHHITVRNAKPHTQFNKFYMPAFYKLVLICCKSSPEFLEAWWVSHSRRMHLVFCDSIESH